MGLFRTNREKLLDSKIEERLYEIAASEVASNDLKPGLWAKAFTKLNGNQSGAEAEYIRLRVDQLRIEHRAAQDAHRAAEAVPKCSVDSCGSAAETKLLGFPMCKSCHAHYEEMGRGYRGSMAEYLKGVTKKPWGRQ